ncbi:TOM1-like protein 6 [Amaranthus tricolor]|uniref:TOM1-like protein 6 n=1 Tax=Amaranthus tricolor TaxID=29722 RepID=UPI002586BB24|nr:TOM1-like protein 6 [Amaranthus tricolor]
MLPSLSLSPSSSSVSATIRVDKATSELLVGPDWSMNMDICDFCNSNHWLAKDVVKEVKRRLQHKNPKVQLLTLTLLETMVKNCGEYIHYHISERKILDEMIKLVKKKAGMYVREKILVLLDSWQEAFGGPGGKYSQYYWACDELRRSGVHFPQRSPRSAPVITPPVSHQSRVTQIGFGMPANSSRRLDEAMSSEVESLSASTLKSMENVLELLDDMLQAVNPNDRMSVKDEVIVDLADRCRSNQKKLMQMITSTSDEGLLAQGLELNDSLQGVLARHDGIAAGTPLPNLKKDASLQQSATPDSNAKTTEVRDKTPVENGKSPASDPPGSTALAEVEEEEDEFALLARRHSKSPSAPSQSAGTGFTEDAASSSGSNNALVLFDATAPATATTNSNAKEQDLIDLLSIVLTTNPTPSETLPAPESAPAQNAYESSFNNYVVPWAQPQPQQTAQLPQQIQPQYQSMQSQMPTQSLQGYAQYSSAYPPPPWEATSGYGSNQIPSYNPYLYPTSQGPMNNPSMSMQGAWPSQNVYSQYGNQPMYYTQAVGNSSPLQTARTLQQSNSFHNLPSANGNLNSTAQTTDGSLPINGGRSLQHVNSFPAKVNNGTAMNGTTPVLNNGSTGISSGQKTYIPSYRLFEDLNVLSGSEGKLKSGPYSSASGTRT